MSALTRPAARRPFIVPAQVSLRHRLSPRISNAVAASALGVIALSGAASFAVVAQTPTAATSPAPALDPVVAEAKKLIEQKRAPAAFQKLAALEAARAGESSFDYWLGVAAFESGKLERAAIAFERALVVDPDFDSARMELGRTYLRMGSLDLAEQEFRRLLPRTQNADGKQMIESYLTEIARLKDRQKFATSAFVEVGAGHDTNLSSTTGSFSDAIRASFGLSGILPSGNSVKRSDNFGALNGGGEFVWRYREDRTLFATASARLRSYKNEKDFQYGLIDVAVGHELRYGTSALSYVAFGQLFRQDGAFVDTIASTRIKNDRNSGGASIDWRTEIASNAQLTLGAQGSVYRYRSNPTQDTDQGTLSATVTMQPEAFSGSTFGISTFGGKDRAKRPLIAGSSTDVSRRNLGLRMFGQTDLRNPVSANASIGYSQRRDDSSFARATLVEYGKDRLLDASFRLTWRVAESWAIVPYVAYVRNQSNIALYNFNKTEGGIMFRFDLQ
jgi:tetratricopeptide (TPR) repeat protein